ANLSVHQSVWYSHPCHLPPEPRGVNRMTPISSSTAALLRELVASPNFFSRLVTARNRGTIVDEISATGEVAVIPTLAPFLFDEPIVSLATCRAIARLLPLASSDDLLTLDEELRQWLDWKRGCDWTSQQPERLSQIKTEADTADSVYAVIS